MKPQAGSAPGGKAAPPLPPGALERKGTPSGSRLGCWTAALRRIAAAPKRGASGARISEVDDAPDFSQGAHIFAENGPVNFVGGSGVRNQQNAVLKALKNIVANLQNLTADYKAQRRLLDGLGQYYHRHYERNRIAREQKLMRLGDASEGSMSTCPSSYAESHKKTRDERLNPQSSVENYPRRQLPGELSSSFTDSR